MAKVRNSDKKPIKVLVSWTCDKFDCGKDNLRRLLINHIIVNDMCSHCGMKIHEPITKEVKV